MMSIIRRYLFPDAPPNPAMAEVTAAMEAARADMQEKRLKIEDMLKQLEKRSRPDA